MSRPDPRIVAALRATPPSSPGPRRHRPGGSREAISRPDREPTWSASRDSALPAPAPDPPPAARSKTVSRTGVSPLAQLLLNNAHALARLKFFIGILAFGRSQKSLVTLQGRFVLFGLVQNDSAEEVVR